jgi:flavin-dependent dehydrogenase
MRGSLITKDSKIAVVGAGPAGTSTAIRLARRGFRVSLFEREKFPRQKLCGEFISPECFSHFRDLGVFAQMLDAGGDRITETIFYSPGGRSVSVQSEWFRATESALGLSRAEMDLILLRRAAEAGVEVFEDSQITGLLTENGKATGLKTKTGEFEADLIIDATGRARILGKLAAKLTRAEQPASGRKLVGFKAHLRNVSLERGRCEIYFFHGGYGGLNYIEDGQANHCFLIDAEVVREFGGDVNTILKEVVFRNSRAATTLAEAENVYDWLAVAVDGFGKRELNPLENLIAVGDAGAFIDPFTGSGMLMAFESAELLSEAVQTGASAEEVFAVYERAHHLNFSRRLRVCRLIREAAFSPKLTASVIAALSFARAPVRYLARATRRNANLLAK